MEARETFYLLDYQLIMKGCNSGTVKWKRLIEQGMGKVSVPSLGANSVNFHVFTKPEALRPSHFMETSLHKHD